MTILWLALGSYLLGGIPCGVLVSRMYGVDIMSFGSKNPGATNVIRALGWKVGVFVFILDVFKGLIPAVVSRAFIKEPLHGLDAQAWWMVMGLIAVAGHCLSPFLKFKGGKGVATTFGAAIGAVPLVAGVGITFFIILLATTRYMAVASTVAICSAVVLGLTVPGQTHQLVPVYALLGFFVAYRHRANFKRLAKGTEPKFSFKKTKPTDSAADGAQEAAASDLKDSEPVG